MEFLKPIDKINLRKVLIKVKQLQTAYDRSSFLEFCGLNKYLQSLELEQPMDKFVVSMIAQFSDKYQIVGGYNQRVLIVCLQYLRDSEYLYDDNDITFINSIINKPDWHSLLQDKNLTSFYDLINQLQRLSEARRFDDNKCQKIVQIFQRISYNLQAGNSLIKVFKSVQEQVKTIDNTLENVVTKFSQESEVIKQEIGYEIPIVLLVMNQNEAQELDSEKAFREYHNGLYDRFKQLKNKLTENGIDNWVDHYQETAKQWQPFNQNNSLTNIQHLIEDAFIEVQYEQKIIPKFIDINQLNQDNKDSFKLLQKLRHQGCIVIMDAISMQHPKIQGLFRRATLDAFPNTLVVMIAPIYSVFDIVKKIESVIEQRIDIDFYRRLELNDSKCRKAGDKTEFQSWLINQIPCLLPKIEEEKPPESVRNYMYKMGGN